MKLFVKVKTGQKENEVILPPLRLMPDPEDEQWYTIRVKERPIENRANIAIIKLLAEHFKISRSKIRLISGATSKRKVIEIVEK